MADPFATLQETEVFWRDHYRWLEQSGYRLRPRYNPDWIPSWKGLSADHHPREFEDGQVCMRRHLLDGVRISDGAMVKIKYIKKEHHPLEAGIARYLTSEPLVSDPRNHSCPVYDILQDPNDDDILFMMMPLLHQHDDPPYETVGEAVGFFQQIFEGLAYMHSIHVAHRDCMTLNIMMDPRPMFPRMFHPIIPTMTADWRTEVKPFSRTERPPRYYLIDFGLSRRFSPDDPNPLEPPILGGDQSVPELQEDTWSPRNPFPTDVYYLGNMIRKDFMKVYRDFGFIEPLVDAMCARDPAARPHMDEVVARLGELVPKLSNRKLRSRLRKREDEGLLGKAVANVRHLFRTTGYMAKGFSAIPIPQSHQDHSVSVTIPP